MGRALIWNPEERRLRAGWRAALFFLGWGLGPALVHTVVDPALDAWANPDRLWLVSIALDFLRFVTVLAVAWLVAHWVDRRHFADYGFHVNWRWVADLTFGVALGTVLMAAVFLVEWLAGWVRVEGFLVSGVPGLPFWAAILQPLMLYVTVAVAEELLTRGDQILNFTEGLGGWGFVRAVLAAWALSSLIFGLLHVLNPFVTWASIANLTLLGFLWGLGYLLTGELALPIGMHFAWNFVQGNVFGFPVSGKVPHTATVVAIEQQGPDLWTGGAFGPEAGVLGILAAVAGMAATILWVRWRYGDLALRRLHVWKGK